MQEWVSVQCVRRPLLVVALALFGGDAGAGGAADEDALLEHLGGAGADFRQGADDLVSLELHLAAGVADVGDFAVGFDIVAGIDWGFEFDHVVGAEEAFVAVLLDEEFGGDIAKEVNHVCAINQIAAIVGVFCAHTNA